jgi:hypothetical protein
VLLARIREAIASTKREYFRIAVTSRRAMASRTAASVAGVTSSMRPTNALELGGRRCHCQRENGIDYLSGRKRSTKTRQIVGSRERLPFDRHPVLTGDGRKGAPLMDGETVERFGVGTGLR